MLYLSALSSVVPPAILTAEIRSEARSPRFGYLLEDGGEHLMPCRRLGFSEAEEAALRPDGPSPVPVAGKNSLSEIGAQAALPVVEHFRRHGGRALDALLLCHSTVDEDIFGSAALKIQETVGIPSALTFGLAQAGGCQFYYALQLLDRILDGDGAGLIVAAEKIFYPHVRRMSDVVSFADGAAAALVTRGPRGARIGYVNVLNDDKFVQPLDAALCLSPRYARSTQARLNQAIRSLDPECRFIVVPPGVSLQFLKTVQSELPSYATAHTCSLGTVSHFGSADPLVQLQRHLERISMSTALVWTTGFSHATGIALFENCQMIDVTSAAAPAP